MSARTRVLLVEDNEGDQRLLEAALAEGDRAQIDLCHVSRLADAVSWLGRESFDLILLDLFLPDSQGLNSIAQAGQAAPGVPILVLTGLDDEATAVRALEIGAQDYLVKGKFDGKQLVRAIRYALARNEVRSDKPGRGSEAPHRVIGFLGAKGGCGVTTIACHLAGELGRQAGGKTLLADFDLVAGMVQFLMKTQSPYSVLEAAGVDDLDRSHWASIVCNYTPNLDVLAAPASLAGKMLPRPERLARLLKFTQLNYVWTVVDLGRGLSDFSLSLLDRLDTSFIVTTPDVLALARTRQVVEALLEGGYPQDRLRLIVNRMPRRPALPPREIRRLLKLPVEAILPDSPEDLAACYTHGKLAPAGSAIGEQFAHLAAKLAGIQAPRVRPRWFSLRGRPAAESATGAPAGGPPPAGSGAGQSGLGRPETAEGKQLAALLEGPSAGLAGGPEAAVRQLNRQLAEAKAEFQQFAHLASHDLREPLRVIAGYVQLLAQRRPGRSDAETEDLLASAREGVAQMQERIDGMLEYSRVVGGGAGFQPVACEEALAQSLAALDEQIARSSAVVSHDGLPVVRADAPQIRNVFHRLISNALTFRSAAPPRVHVRAEPGENEWVFSVRDNGIGLDPQHAVRIFQLFQRLHTRSELPGAGVGLAVVKRVVERHGGRIWVESEPGKGATFYFTVPRNGSQ
jgi:signal transduction histidine kinase/cellulose biosynthesis protein BcsQ/CheY-like chemotaxis protein